MKVTTEDAVHLLSTYVKKSGSQMKRLIVMRTPRHY